MLVEHTWLIPLRDSVLAQGGIVLAQEFLVHKHFWPWVRISPSQKNCCLQRVVTEYVRPTRQRRDSYAR